MNRPDPTSAARAWLGAFAVSIAAWGLLAWVVITATNAMLGG